MATEEDGQALKEVEGMTLIGQIVHPDCRPVLEFGIVRYTRHSGGLLDIIDLLFCQSGSRYPIVPVDGREAFSSRAQHVIPMPKLFIVILFVTENRH
jgi:hypothetical protein